MVKIKFGTDGWRAIIAREYTVDNVKRVAAATAKYIKSQSDLENTIVLGYDCRFGGRMFCETVACVYVNEGIKVKMSEKFVSTPMISLAAHKYNSGLGIILTASHNPPDYNGYKVKANFGGPAAPSVITAIENIIPEKYEEALPNFDEIVKSGDVEFVFLEDMYFEEVDKNFNLDAIRNSGLKVAFDAMYGAGQNIFRRILPNATLLHCEYNPSFMGTAPEPIHKNLIELSNYLKNNAGYSAALANDGDADRIGMYDGNGLFVDSHHLILLLIKYLHKYKKLNGKVIIAASVTDKVKKLCDMYGLNYEVTKVGFKYIAEKMTTEDVLIGAEESGGIAVKGFIPERDGIWVGLLMFEFMAETGKSLAELVRDIYEEVGAFFYKRNDLHITEELKLGALEKCKAGIKKFGNFEVTKEDTIDGFRYNFDKEQWLMIRASGTEPVLRVYAQSENEAGADAILKAAKATLL